MARVWTRRPNLPGISNTPPVGIASLDIFWIGRNLALVVMFQISSLYYGVSSFMPR